MIRLALLLSCGIISACGASAGNIRPGIIPDGRGQYVRPEYLAPTPTLRLPPVDACRSQLYQGLIGRHEGAIYIAGLPGRKRILKPAFREGFGYLPEDDYYTQPPSIEVRDYIPDQVLYAPSIRTVTDRLQLGPEQQDRLTIELNQEGYVQEIRCE